MRVQVHLALVLAATGLVACGGEDTDPRAASVGTPSAMASNATSSAAPSGTLSATAPDGSAIPDGTWAKTATKAEAEKLGLPPDLITEHVGADGEIPVELRFKGRDYAQFMTEDGGPAMVLGDRGTAGYDAAGRWVATSLSEGCSGCSASFDWTVVGDRLTLKAHDLASNGDPMDALVTRLIMEGTFVRH